MSKLNLSLTVAGVIVGLAMILGIAFRVLFLNYIDNYEFGYMFDAQSGSLYALVDPDGEPKQGYIYSLPFVQSVHTIDTRPMQVCINANSRVLNCKLVQFDPNGFRTFLAWHGRGNYGANEGNLKDIMLSYAYDPSKQEYPFLKILKELKNQDPTTDELVGGADSTKTQPHE
jgi:hypothetical protein